jgi:CHAT domain-containing protein
MVRQPPRVCSSAIRTATITLRFLAPQETAIADAIDRGPRSSRRSSSTDASFDRLVTEFSSTQYDVVHFAGHAGSTS